MKLFNLLYQDVYSVGQGTLTGSFLSFLLGFFFILLIIILVIFLLTAIGQWKLFKKAGKRGWEAFIPIYNTYILCQITGVNPWWIVIVFASGVITSIIPALSIVGTVANVYFGVLLAVSVARSFGKSDGYAVGIYFFGFIFYLVLGFDNSEYLGPKPMKDIIFKDESNPNYNTGNPNTSNPNNASTLEAKVDESTNSSQDVHYCPSCGTKLTIDTKYCPHCGREL